jgi:hypothetical protein
VVTVVNGAALSFDEHVRRMHQITIGAEQYGAGVAYEQATRYYLDHLVEECAERARRGASWLPDRVDLLISVTGLSPRTTILAFKVLRPRRLVVIPSENARGSVNTIARYVVGEAGLQQADFSQRPCVPTDPLSIYNVVKDELDLLDRQDGQAISYIDITGGRKVMSATAALAAWQLDLGLCYLDGEFDPELRQAVPGSDRLLLLDNPTSLFGEQEMNAAHQAFDGGAYEAARNRFEELSGRLARPTDARFWGAMSRLYGAWCDLDLVTLPVAIDMVRRTLGPMQQRLPAITIAAVEAQLAFLDRLAHREEDALLLSFNLLDDHYRGVGRHDFAALFSYRTIERCLTGRLGHLYPGLGLIPPDYGLVTDDKQALRDRYRAVCDEVNGTSQARSLPSRLNLFSSAALLLTLDDPLSHAAQLGTADELRTLRNLAEARNGSVLAHGEASVSATVSSELNAKALEVLGAYWKLWRPDEDLAARRAELAFLRAMETTRW